MILILGSPRSGTTWLGKIFDSHPDTLYRHEPDSCIHAELPIFVEEPVDEQLIDQAREYAEEIVKLRWPKVVGKLPLFHKSYQGRLAYEWRRLMVLAAKVASQRGIRLDTPDMVSRRGRSRIVWKSIESPGRLALLARAIPDVRVVHIVRHPCGNVASILRGEARGGFTAEQPASEDYGIIRMLLATGPARRRGLTEEGMRALTEVERLAWVWGLTNELAMQSAGSLPNCRVLRYEDLCEDPLPVSRELFEFCGLAWSTQTEAFVGASTARETGEFHSVFKDPRKSASKWREELPADDIARIRAIAAQTAPGKLFTDITGA